MTHLPELEVACLFTADGAIHVQRLKLDGRWQAPEQGRQWQDEHGRHLLIMLHGRVHTLTLSAATLTWALHQRGQTTAV